MVPAACKDYFYYIVGVLLTLWGFAPHNSCLIVLTPLSTL